VGTAVEAGEQRAPALGCNAMLERRTTRNAMEIEWREIESPAGYKDTVLYIGFTSVGSYLHLSDGYYPIGARKPSLTEDDAKRRVVENAKHKYRALLSALDKAL
jgi:hypothetical protein